MQRAGTVAVGNRPDARADSAHRQCHLRHPPVAATRRELRDGARATGRPLQHDPADPLPAKPPEHQPQLRPAHLQRNAAAPRAPPLARARARHRRSGVRRADLRTGDADAAAQPDFRSYTTAGPCVERVHEQPLDRQLGPACRAHLPHRPDQPAGAVGRQRWKRAVELSSRLDAALPLARVPSDHAPSRGLLQERAVERGGCTQAAARIDGDTLSYGFERIWGYYRRLALLSFGLYWFALIRVFRLAYALFRDPSTLEALLGQNRTALSTLERSYVLQGVALYFASLALLLLERLTIRTVQPTSLATSAKPGAPSVAPARDARHPLTGEPNEALDVECLRAISAAPAGAPVFELGWGTLACVLVGGPASRRCSGGPAARRRWGGRRGKPGAARSRPRARSRPSEPGA